MLLEIAEETVSKLKDGIGESHYGCDLHHYLWNEDYYIIGTYDAKKWIESHMSVFDAIAEVQEYENDNFGETNTDITSPENVANMLAYIYGEIVLNSSSTLARQYDNELEQEDINLIIEEIEKEYGL
jgi:hypothetical protein|tara:strand:+ start:903 stop:1283 length:381 start_codon:yes stop_codon:yes gene_type:complete